MAMLGRELDLTLEQIDEMHPSEYADWALLFDIEEQARAQAAENERRRQGG